jgi:hypothetical protein
MKYDKHDGEQPRWDDLSTPLAQGQHVPLASLTIGNQHKSDVLAFSAGHGT